MRMKAYAIFRPYFYGDKLVAIVEGKSTAEILCEKWGCKMKLVDSDLWTKLEESVK